MNLRNFISLSLILFTVVPTAFAAQSANAPSPALALADKDCAPDGTTAGCGSKQFGTGLMACLDAHRKSNPPFALSRGCVDALAGVQIDGACRKDAAADGCGNEVVGGGLLVCLNKFRAANPGKISKPCANEIDGLGVDFQCQQDLGTAGCGISQFAGTGLFVCLNKYRKANPSYKLSSGCQNAVAQFGKEKHL